LHHYSAQIILLYYNSRVEVFWCLLDERDGETSASVPRDSSPVSNIPSQATTAHGTVASPQNQKVEASDEFDPRGPISGTVSHMNIFIFILDSSCTLALIFYWMHHITCHYESFSNMLDRIEEMLIYIWNLLCTLFLNYGSNVTNHGLLRLGLRIYKCQLLIFFCMCFKSSLIVPTFSIWNAFGFEAVLGHRA
jgi:hypothetical protein